MSAKPISQAFALEVFERLKHLVPVGSKEDCWQYGGYISKQTGYGTIHAKAGNRWNKYHAHRLIYTALVGELPTNIVLDHTCRNRRCVNPNHLDPVTDRVNVRRGATIIARALAKTHCKNGHPFNAANTFMRGNHRRCRACNILYKLRSKQAAKGTLMPLSEAKPTDEHFQCLDTKRLEAIDAQISKLRDSSVDLRFENRTHCPKGHEYDQCNTYINKQGHRSCRACHRESERKRRERQKQQYERNRSMKEAA